MSMCMFRNHSERGKLKTRFVAGAALIAASMLFVSCPREIGLGGAVDTQKPVVSILTPEVDEVLKDVITLTGKASDETALESVFVTFQSTESSFSKTYTANVDMKAGTWSLTINTEDDTNGLPDYKYEAIATAKDKSGKTTTAARSFQIDNSAPTILVTKPSTFGGSETVAFYKQVEIKGETYDASSVQWVKVGLYTDDGTLVCEKTADGTDTWSVLFYENDFRTSSGAYKPGVLSNISQGVRKPVYIYVKSEDKGGNVSTYYYHKSDVYSILSEKKSAGDELYFPTTAQIGQLEASRAALNVNGVNTSGQSITYPVSKAELNGKKHEAFSASSASMSYPYLYFTNEATASIEWNNINLQDPLSTEYNPLYYPSISQTSEILASIQPVSDGSSVNLDTLKMWFIKEDATIELSYANGDFEAHRMGEAVNLTIDLTSLISTGTYDVYLYGETNSGTKVGYKPRLASIPESEWISLAIKDSNDYDENGNNGGYICQLSVVSVNTAIDTDQLYPHNLASQQTIFPEPVSADVTDVWYINGSFYIPVTITSLNQGSTISMKIGSADADIAPSPVNPTPSAGSRWYDVSYRDDNSTFEGKYKVEGSVLNALVSGKQTRMIVRVSVGGSANTDVIQQVMVQKDTDGPTLTVESPVSGTRYTSVSDGDVLNGSTLSIKGTAYEATGAGLKAIDNVSSMDMTQSVFYQLRTKDEYGNWRSYGEWTPCTVSTSDNATWTASVNIGNKGEKSIRIKAVDNLGNESVYSFGPAASASEDIAFFYDDTAPELTGVDAIPQYFNASSGTASNGGRKVTISGTVTDDWAVDVFEVKLDGVVQQVGRNAANWSKDYLIGAGSNTTLSEGNHTFAFTVTDKSGRQTTATKTVTVDTVVPTVSIPAFHENNNAANAKKTTTNWFNSKTVPLSVTATEDSETGSGIEWIKYTFDNPVTESSTWVTKTNPATTLIINETFANDGPQTISLKIKDRAGNESASVNTYNFSLDTSAPVLNVTGDAPVGAADGVTVLKVGTTWYVKGAIKLSGTVSDENGLAATDGFIVSVGGEQLTSGVTLGAAGATPGAARTWSVTIPKDKLSDTVALSVEITATDLSGTSTTKTYRVRLDESAPILTPPSNPTLLNDGTSITEQSQGSLSFQVADDGVGVDTIKYSLNGAAQVTAPSAPVVIALSAGAGQSIAFEIKDKLGNTLNKSYTNINYDYEHPELTAINPAPAFVKVDESYVFGGKATDDIALDKVRVTATRNNQRVDFNGEATTSGYWYEKSFTGTVTTANAAALAIPNFTTTGKDPDVINGSWKFTIEVLDRSGNVSTSVVRELTADISKPVIAGVSQYPGVDPLVNSSSPYQFNGTASDDGTGLQKVEYTFTNPSSTNPAPEWTPVTGTNNWYGSLGIPGSEGQGTVWFRALDIAGNYSDVFERTFVYDTSAPTLRKVEGWDGLNKPLSGYTNASYKLYIEASDGWGLDETTPLTITQTNSGINGGNAVNVTVPAGSSPWTITGLPVNGSGASQTSPASGTYIYTVTAKDKAGKQTEKTVSVTVDTTAPNVNTITSPTDDKIGKKAIVGDSYMFRGTAKDVAGGSGVEKIQYAFTTDGNAEEADLTDWTNLTVSDGDWTFSKDLVSGADAVSGKLNEGRWYMWVRVWDRAGNVSSAVYRMFDIDLDNPTLTITEPNTNNGTKYVKDTLTISGTATDTNGLAASTATTTAVSVKVGNTIRYATVTGSSWTIDLSKADYDNNTLLSATVTVTDKAGKTTSAAVPFYFDTNGPKVEITKPQANSATTANLTIEGSITDDGIGSDVLYYTLDGTDPDPEDTTTPKITITSGQTSWTKDVTISGAQGQKTLKVCAKDKLGNVSTAKTVSFYYDLADPELEETSIGDNGASKNEAFTLAGTASDTNGLSTTRPVTISNSKNSTTWTVIPDGDGYWSQNFRVSTTTGSDAPLIADGTVLFTITAEDVAGKQTKLTRSVTVDTTPPTIGAGSFANTLVKLDESPYNTLTIPVTDPNGSGVKNVYYAIGGTTAPAFTGTANTDWTAMTQGTGGWQANINFPATTPDGSIKVWIAAIDMSENKTTGSAIKSVTTTVDRQKPVISVSGPAITNATATNGSDATYTVTITDSSDVTAPTITLKNPDGTTVNGQGFTINGSDNKSKTVTVRFKNGATHFGQSGKYKIVVNVNDENGRAADTVEYAILRDVTKPVISLTNHNEAEEYTQSKTLQVTGTVTEKNLSSVTATLTKDGAEGTPETITVSGTTDTKSFDWKKYEQGDGEYVVTIKATDLAGNEESKDTKKVIIDTTAPDSTLTKSGTLFDSTNYQPVDDIEAGGSYLAKAGFTLSGTITEINFKEASLAIKKNGISQPSQSIRGTGAWSYTQPVNAATHANDGEYTYTLTVKDHADNSFTQSVTIKVDTTAPVLAVTEPIDGYNTDQGSETIKGTAIDNGSGLSRIYYALENTAAEDYDEDAEPTTSVTTISGSNWQTTGYFGSAAGGSVEGDYVLKVMAVDVLGNKTEVIKRNYKCDINPPDLTETVVGDGGLITNNTFSLTGKAWDTNGIAELTVTGQGKTWSSEDSSTSSFFTFDKAAGNKKLSAAAVTNNNWSLNFVVGNNAEDMIKANWLKDGTVAFVITIKDVAGKTKTINRTVTIDTTNPTVSIETDDGFTDTLVCQDVSPYNRLTVHATDPEQKDGGTVIGTGTTGLDGVFYKISNTNTAPAFTPATESSWTAMAQGANGTWTANVDFSGSDEGIQKAWVAVKDRAGNRIVCSDYVQTTIDARKPVLEVVNASSATFTSGTDVTLKLRVNDTNPVKPSVTVTKPDGTPLGVTLTVADTPVGFSDVPGSEYTEWNATIPFNSSASYFKQNSAYVNGVYTVTINGTDENNRAATAITHGIELDSIKPVVSFTSYTEPSSQRTQNITVTGTITEKNLTDVQAWYVKEGEAGDPVQVSIMDSVGQATNGVRSFSWKQYELSEGNYTVYIKATDKAGLTNGVTTGGSVTYDKTAVITIDMTAPESTILQGSSGQQWNADGTQVTGTALAYNSTYYAKDTFILKGEITENQLKSAKITVKKDSETPVEKNIFSKDGSGVTVDPDAGCNWASTSNTWSFTQNKNAGDGKYVYTLSLEDKAGNTTTKTITVILDTADPVVTAAMTQSASTQGYSAQNTITVTGSASDANLTTVTAALFKGATQEGNAVDITESLAQNGTFSWKKTGLTDGSYTVKITAKDSVGHSVTAPSDAITVDTTAPVSTFTTNTGDVLYGSSDYQPVTEITDGGSYLAKAAFTLRGVITETNFWEASLAIKKDNVSQTPKSITSVGSWNYAQTVNTTTHANDGTYEYTLTVVDRAGNRLEKSITVKVDTTAPEVSITIPAADQAFPSSPAAISGSVTDSGAGVKKVYYTTDGNNPNPGSDGTTAVAPIGSGWSSSLSFSEQGAFILKVVAEDKLGQMSVPVSVPFSYDYDLPGLVETIVGEDGLTTNANFEFGGKAWDSNRLEQVSISATINGVNKTWSSSNWSGSKTDPTSNFLDIDDGVASSADDVAAANWHFNFKVGEGNISDSAYIPDGTTVFTITVTDVAHKSLSYVRTVTVDTKKPLIEKNAGDGFTKTLVESDVSPYNTLKIHVSDTGAGATGLESTYYQIAASKPDFEDEADDADWTPMIRGANNLWTADVDFSDATTYPDGNQYAWIAAKDRAGNRTVFASSLETCIDIAKPVLSVQSGDNFTDATEEFAIIVRVTDTNPNTPIITVVKPDANGLAGGDTLSVQDAGVNILPQTTTTAYKEYKVIVPFDTSANYGADGTYTLKINANDLKDRAADQITWTVLKDKTPPVVELTSHTTETFTSNRTLTVTGKVKDSNLSTVTAWLNNTTAEDITNLLGDADADGKQSFEWKQYDLTEGIYYVHVKATDRANLTNAADGEISAAITVDYTAPASTLTWDTESDTVKLYNTAGSAVNVISAGGTYLAKQAFTLTGTVDEVLDNTTTSLTVSKDGAAGSQEQLTWNGLSWSYAQAADATGHTNDGTYTYSFVFVDKAGNRTEKALSVIVDTEKPEVSITSPTGSDSFDANTSITIKGTAIDDGVGTKCVYYTTDGTEPTTGTLNKIQLNGGSNWSGSLGTISSEGTITLKVLAEDKLGHTSDVVSIDFYRDNSNPEITVTSPETDGLTKTADFILEGKACDTNGIDEITVTAQGKTWSTKSGAGKIQSITLDADTEIDSKKEHTSDVTGANWHLSYVVGSGSSTQPTYLSDGTITFNIAIKDKAGKTSTSIRTVTVDTTVPVITKKAAEGANPADGFASSYVYVDESPFSTLRIHAEDTGSGASGVESTFYQITPAKTNGADTPAPSFTSDTGWTQMIRGANNLWSAEIDFSSGYTDGEYKAWFAAKDRAGNRTTVFNDSTIKTTVDLKKPVVTITGPTEAKATEVTLIIKVADTNGKLPLISGDAPDIKVLKADNSVISSPELSISTKTATTDYKEYELSIPFNRTTYASEGKYTVQVQVQDDNGRSSAVVTHTIRKDTQAPAVNTIDAPGADIDLTASNASESALYGTSYIFKGTAKDLENSTDCAGLDRVLYAFTTSAAAPASDTPAALAANWTSLTMEDGSWTILKSLNAGKTPAETGNLYEGVWYLHVLAEDKAGNLTAAATTRKFAVDMSNPALTVSSPADLTQTQYIGKAASGDTTFTMSGEVTESNDKPTLKVKIGTADAITVTLTDKPGETGTYTWSYTATMTDSNKDRLLNAEFTLTDSVGKKDTKTVPFYFDTAAPVVTITLPKADEKVDGDTYNISGTVSDAGSGIAANAVGATYDTANARYRITTGAAEYKGLLEINGASWKADNVSLGSSEGNITLEIEIKDNKGQSDTVTRSFTKDKNPPVITVLGESSRTEKGTFTLSGTASDSNALKSGNPVKIEAVKGDGTTNVLGTVEVPVSNGSWTKTFTPGTDTGFTGSDYDGTYTFTFTVTDVVGKTSTAKCAVTVDHKPPDITLTNNSCITSAAQNGWYKETTIDLGAVVKDAGGTGIKSVEYAVSSNPASEPDENTWKDLTIGWKPLSQGNTENDPWTATATVKDGTNYIVIRAADVAGNVAYTAQKIAKVDSKAPILKGVFYNDDGTYKALQNVVTNTTGAITMFVKAQEIAAGNLEGSGIARIVASIADQDFETTTYTYAGETYNYPEVTDSFDSDSTDTTIKIYELEIPENYIKYSFPEVTDEVKTVYVQITDTAGNVSTAYTLLQLQSDKTPPEVEFVSPAANQTEADSLAPVNKRITVSGKASDLQGLKKVTLKYQYKKKDTWGTTQTVGSKTGIQANNWSFDLDTNSSKILNSVLADGDVSILKLIVDAEDTAGNKSTEEIEVKVDQLADRPQITLQNLNIQGMSETTRKDVTGSSEEARKIIGTIIDDDGISELSWSKDGITYTTLDTTGGSFTLNTQIDGEFDIQFKAKDIKGTEFISGTAAGSGTDFSLLPLKDSAGNVSSDGMLYIIVDTEVPKTLNTLYALDGTSVTETDWTEGLLSDANNVFGGTDKTEFTIRQYAYDANKIKSIDIYIDGIKVASTDPGTETSLGTVTKVPATGFQPTRNVLGSTYDAYTYTVDATQIAKDEENPQRERALKIEITDYANQKTVKENISFKVDNAKPTVTINSHANGEQVSGSFLVSGTTLDTPLPVPATSLVYTVSKSDTLPAGYDWSDARTVIDPAGSLSSWRVYFDNGQSSDGYTHDRTLKQILVDLDDDLVMRAGSRVVWKEGNSQGKTANEAYRTITPLYLHFKATDAYGNASVFVRMLRLDPQGDIPTVTVAYPAVTAYGWKAADNSIVYTKEKEPAVGAAVYSNFPALTTSAGTVSSSDFAKMVGTDITQTIIVAEKEYTCYGGESVQGGSIYIQGTADDEDRVAAVYMQIDPQYDRARGFNWVDSGLATLPNGTTVKAMFTSANVSEPIETIGNSTEKGIKIGESISWSVELNGDGEYNGLNNANNYIGLRFYSVDASGNVSQMYKSNDLVMTIDSDTPLIGDSEPLYLYQYEDNSAGTGNKTASMKYEDNMWIKGIWWLEGSVEDENGINKDTLKVKKQESNTWSEITAEDSISISKTSDNNYHVKFKIGSESTTEGSNFGTLSYRIDAKDNKQSPSVPSSVEKVIVVNYDNKAPVLVAADNSDYRINHLVVQNNGFYTLGSAVTEAGTTTVSQSGFDRVALYFVRPGDTAGTGTLYDTYHLKDDVDGNDKSLNRLTINYSYSEGTGWSKSNSSDVTYADGLYWKSHTVTRNPSNLRILTLQSEDKNIHTGGLVKIGGTMYRITEVNGTAITIDGNPQISYTTADFAMALIIDHALIEGKPTENPVMVNGYYTNVTNDDNDNIIEKVTSIGYTTNWEASICSRNIPDGALEIHYVVFDKAGNSAHGVVACNAPADYMGLEGTTNGNPNVAVYDYDAGNLVRVANNAPRLAGIRYGTDDNGNGQVDSSELNYKNLAMTGTDDSRRYNAENLYTSYVLGTKSSEGVEYVPALKVKGITMIKPEIIGGNKALKYTLEATKSSNGVYENAAYYKKALDDLGMTGGDYSGNGTIIGELVEPEIVLSISDLLSAGEKGTLADGTNQILKFIIWDSTEGLAAGSTSQHADIELVVDIAVRDMTPPVTYIKPFWWKSKTENSIYKDGSNLKGHIDLGSDISAIISAATDLADDIIDDDDKISGSVIIEGSAYDNILLQDIYMKLYTGDPTDDTDAFIWQTGDDSYAVSEALQNKNGANNPGIGTFYKVAHRSDSGWVGSGNFDTYGWEFSIKKDAHNKDVETISQDGHTVEWQLLLNTEKLKDCMAVADLQLMVVAKDKGNPSASGSYTPNTTKILDTGGNFVQTRTSGTTTTTQTNYNKFDVVPYITGVSTQLSILKKTNPTLYNRSALGHYTVASTETVVVAGFNLEGAKYNGAGNALTSLTTDEVGALLPFYKSEATSFVKLPVSSISASGAIKLTQTENKIPTLNNLNNNDGKAGAAKKEIIDNKEQDVPITALTDDNCGTYGYNRQPNGDNNQKLTDDVYFDIWEFDSDAVKPISGKIEQPVMKINPANDKIGFAFVNGPLYFSMGGNDGGTVYSYQYWMGSYDFFTSVGFTYDKLGYSYGTAAGGDINSNAADHFNLMTSRWGTGGHGQRGSYDGENALRLESIAIKENDINQFDKQRIKSPSLATAVHGSATNLYLAYYDQLSGEIRFKYGAIGSGTVSLDPDLSATYSVTIANTNRLRFDNQTEADAIASKAIWLLDNSKSVIGTATASARQSSFSGYYYVTLNNASYNTGKSINNIANLAVRPTVTANGNTSKEAFGNFTDQDTGEPPKALSHASVSLIAGGTSGRAGGEYVSIAAISSEGSTVDDTVVAVWYDSETLWYAYNTTPTTDRKNTTNGAGWTVSRVFAENSDQERAGEYCKVTVDKDGGVHIACYDPINLDLCYAYMPSSKRGVGEQSDFQTCVVDSNGVVGSNLNIDVAKVNGKWVPYIGYYATSCVKPKYAYLADTTTAAPAGVVNDAFTGAWECMVLPTSSQIEMQSNQHNDINIGVWKDADTGVIKTSYEGQTATRTNSHTASGTGYESTSYGQVYGNGKTDAAGNTYPVLGYAVKNGASSDNIETAQMK